MWVGIKGILGKQAGEAGTGAATLRAQKGNVVRSLKGKREMLVEHYRKLGTPTTNKTFDLGRGERMHQNGKTVQKGNRESSQRKKSKSVYCSYT